MRATEEKWVERVSGWRESGLTAEKYCEDREFSAGGLRHWAYRLGKTKQRRGKPGVRIARVLRAPAAAASAAKATTSATEPVDSALAVELGGVRVVVRPGFEPRTLAALLDVLATRGDER